jgi:hypothetical protein
VRCSSGDPCGGGYLVAAIIITGLWLRRYVAVDG